MKGETAETTLEIDCPEIDCRGMAVETLEKWSEDSLRTQAGNAKTPCTIDVPVVGIVAAFRDGIPMIDFPANGTGSFLAARSTVALHETNVGREVVLLFEQGDSRRPIVVGLIQNPELGCRGVSGNPDAQNKEQRVVELDGDKLILSAEREIVLRCGQASITLTRAGKILVRGAYLLSRSSGINRIKGAAVQIN